MSMMQLMTIALLRTFVPHATVVCPILQVYSLQCECRLNNVHTNSSRGRCASANLSRGQPEAVKPMSPTCGARPDYATPLTSCSFCCLDLARLARSVIIELSSHAVIVFTCSSSSSRMFEKTSNRLLQQTANSEKRLALHCAWKPGNKRVAQVNAAEPPQSCSVDATLRAIE